MVEIRRNRSFSPSVERMEVRKLLNAAYTVTNFTDNASVQGSLRWAAQLSNMTPSSPDAPNVINFQSNISYGVIEVTHGPIYLTSSVNIIGDGQQISGGGVSQIFVTAGSNTVAGFVNLKLEHGRANGNAALGNYSSGGAILNCGAAIGLYGDVFVDNTASVSGGAVAGYTGNVQVYGSQFTQNHADGYGGAIACNPGVPLVFWGPTSLLYYNTAGIYGGAVQVQASCYIVLSPFVAYDHNFVGHDYTTQNSIYFY